MKNIQNTFYLILFFLLTTSNSFAATSNPTIGGWKVTNTTDFGIGKKIIATKSAIINGAEVVKTSTAAVIPKASNVSKFLAKNAALAVGIAAIEYMLDGVDYVMTEGAIVTKPKTIDPKNSKTWPYLYYANGYNWPSTYSLAAFCSSIGSDWAPHPTIDLRCIPNGNVNYNFPISVSKYPNQSYDPSLVDQPKTIPISDLGAQVVDKAVEDQKRGVISPAVVAARAAAGEMIGESDDSVSAPPVVGSPSTAAEIAKELDMSASFPSDASVEGTISKPAVVDPVTGEVVKPAETSNVDIQIPKACEWFPQACAFFDWMMEDPDLDDAPDLPTKELTPEDIDENLIKIGASSCPAPYPVSIPLPVFNTVYQDSIDISPYCSDIARLAPVLQLIAFVMAVMIIKDI